MLLPVAEDTTQSQAQVEEKKADGGKKGGKGGRKGGRGGGDDEDEDDPLAQSALGRIMRRIGVNGDPFVVDLTTGAAADAAIHSQENQKEFNSTLMLGLSPEKVQKKTMV